MKKVLGLVLAAVVAMGVVSYAGSGCCAAGKAMSDGKGCPLSDITSKLDLTDEQKTKVAALKTECKRASSTSECKTIMSDGLSKILTAEQFAQWKADCDKVKGSGECPYGKGHKND
jgi:Spy/CpxP family protein refolding chaperone